MPTKRYLRGSLISVATLALAAGALAGPTLAQADEDSRSIIVITPFYASQPATTEAVDLFIADATDRGYDTKLVDTAGDNAAVNGEIASAIAQDFDAIVAAFTFSQELGEGLAAAAEADVPVFGLDAGGVFEPMLANVTTDPGDLGSLSAQAIIDALGGEGQVAMIHFDPFEPVRLRAVTARELFEESGIEIVEYIEGSPEDPTGFAKATVLDLLVKYPEGELDAVWGGWDATSWGAFQATQEIGRDEVLVTGVDGQDFAKAEIAKDLNWIATVEQDWATITSTLADVIDAHFEGTDPEDPNVLVPGLLITAENAQ
ncbi:MAG: substrate-binding domain-containing protein [Chloroflexota bacterium]|jgi:ribose transport system substrate-binding protein